MQFQKYVASLLQQHGKIFETLIWKCITFKPRLRTFETFRIVADPPAHLTSLFRPEKIVHGVVFNIAGAAVDQRVQQHLARASHKEIVKSAGTGLFHDPRFEVSNQDLGMITPAEEIAFEKVRHFPFHVIGKYQIRCPIRVQVAPLGDNTGGDDGKQSVFICIKGDMRQFVNIYG